MGWIWWISETRISAVYCKDWESAESDLPGKRENCGVFDEPLRRTNRDAGSGNGAKTTQPRDLSRGDDLPLCLWPRRDLVADRVPG